MKLFSSIRMSTFQKLKDIVHSFVPHKNNSIFSESFKMMTNLKFKHNNMPIPYP